FLLSCSAGAPPRLLPPFPTRRSSDLLGMANGLVSAGLALLLLPVAESLTHITTDLTLLELSDPSRPLLRRLSLEAAGTYAHSIADRKSTRLNSSHQIISYAVFCLKKK